MLAARCAPRCLWLSAGRLWPGSRLEPSSQLLAPGGFGAPGTVAGRG